MPRPPFQTRPLGAVVLTLVLAAALASGVLAPRGALSGPSPGDPAAASKSASKPAQAPSGPLPDTVLARVGARREVTVAMFRRAWAQAQDPRQPDSLTPKSARRFLDLMEDKEALGEKALAAAVPWPRRDSLDLLALRDKLTMKAVLDSALTETARRRAVAGEPELRRMELGVAARETAAAGLDIRYDRALTERLGAAWKALPVPPSDSSVAAQIRMRSVMPAVSPADTGLAVAHSAVGDYRVSELLAQWGWLDPWTRPHIDSAEGIEELVRNGLFERRLRLDAAERGIARRPEIVALLERRREYNAVTALLTRDVFSRIAPDLATLQAWYRGHAELFRVPDHARVARWTLPDRASAGRLAATLRDRAAAESLIAQGTRHGANFLDDVTAASDSALFREAWRLGAGTVLGPDSIPGGWRVATVRALERARVRGFDEVRPMVEKAVADSLGDLGVKRVVKEVRAHTPVREHPRAIALMLAAHD